MQTKQLKTNPLSQGECCALTQLCVFALRLRPQIFNIVHRTLLIDYLARRYFVTFFRTFLWYQLKMSFWLGVISQQSATTYAHLGLEGRDQEK
jgi:hypothetical protein